MSTKAARTLAAILLVTPVMALTPHPTLELRLYPIVADSISSPLNGEEFRMRTTEMAKSSGVELSWRESRPHDETLISVEVKPPELGGDKAWFRPELDRFRMWTLSATKEVPELSPGHHLLMSDWELYRDDTLVYRFAGPHEASAVPAFRRLSIGPEGWILQYMYGRLENDSSGQRMDSVSHHIVLNGTDLGDSLGYENCYFYQHLGAQPFFFCEKNGILRYRFAGVENDAPVERIFKGGGGTILNGPHFYADGFSAFGWHDGVWYLVTANIDRK